MVVRLDEPAPEMCHVGMRMSADEFLALPESPLRYELVGGVVIMSPDASWGHQRIAREILLQLGNYLDKHPVGEAVTDVDVKLGNRLVYRPDIVFLTAEKAARVQISVQESPELVVEIISPNSRLRDSIAKRADYEAAGVREYWLIDPHTAEMQFFVLDSGKYRPARPQGERYASTVLPGFELHLDRVRRLF